MRSRLQRLLCQHNQSRHHRLYQLDLVLKVNVGLELSLLPLPKLPGERRLSSLRLVTCHLQRILSHVAMEARLGLIQTIQTFKLWTSSCAAP